MKSIKDVKKEVAEKFGYENWDELVKKQNLNEEIANSLIEFASEYGYNNGYKEATNKTI